MSTSRIVTLINEVQDAFGEQLDEIEAGLNTNEADVLQLRKSCCLLAGAEVLLEQGFYAVVSRSRRRVLWGSEVTVPAAPPGTAK